MLALPEGANIKETSKQEQILLYYIYSLDFRHNSIMRSCKLPTTIVALLKYTQKTKQLMVGLTSSMVQEIEPNPKGSHTSTRENGRRW